MTICSSWKRQSERDDQIDKTGKGRKGESTETKIIWVT